MSEQKIQLRGVVEKVETSNFTVTKDEIYIMKKGIKHAIVFDGYKPILDSVEYVVYFSGNYTGFRIRCTIINNDNEGYFVEIDEGNQKPILLQKIPIKLDEKLNPVIVHKF